MTTERLCAVHEIADGTAHRFDLGTHQLCVVRLGDAIHCIGDTCTHQDVSLSEGEVDPDERTIECWKHGSTFSLETGAPQALPATRPTPVYEVRVDGDDLFVELP